MGGMGMAGNLKVLVIRIFIAIVIYSYTIFFSHPCASDCVYDGIVPCAVL